MTKFYIFTKTWGVGGSLNLRDRSAFSNTISEMVDEVATGHFGAHMQVELVNDGPVTLWLEV